MPDLVNKLQHGAALGAALFIGVAPVAAAATHARPRAKPRVTYPRRGAAFAGLSSQKSGTLALPVDIRASNNAQYVTRFDIQWAAACHTATGRGTYGGLSITRNKKINPSGVFTDANQFTRAFVGGSKGLFTIKLYGRFTSPLRAAGTFRVTVAITNNTGLATDTCDSGIITWSATN